MSLRKIKPATFLIAIVLMLSALASSVMAGNFNVGGISVDPQILKINCSFNKDTPEKNVHLFIENMRKEFS